MLLNKSKLIVNKSKFYGHIYTIEDIKEIKNLIDNHKKEYKKANHHCCAAIVNEEKLTKNNGEVGYPGKVILQTLKESNLNSHCIIVSRIFGGIKLGPGGVSRAFRDCTRLLTKNL